VKRATGVRNGQPWVQVEIRAMASVSKQPGTLNYPISGSQTIQIHYAAEACIAEPVSAKLMLPQGEKGDAL
jgi:hypothetical protein